MGAITNILSGVTSNPIPVAIAAVLVIVLGFFGKSWITRAMQWFQNKKTAEQVSQEKKEFEDKANQAQHESDIIDHFLGDK